jgi:hypothetical protein
MKRFKRMQKQCGTWATARNMAANGWDIELALLVLARTPKL